MQLIDYLGRYPKKHLIFDFDDTLVSLLIDWSTLRDKFFAFAFSIDPQLVSTIPNVSGAANTLYNQLLLHHSAQVKRQVDEFLQNYELSHYAGYRSNQMLLEFLRDNHARYAISLWTSNQRKTVELVLGDLNIGRYFTTIITANEVKQTKPNSAGFQLIFQPQSQQKIDYLMIGDSVHDAGAAMNAGIDFFKVEKF